MTKIETLVKLIDQSSINCHGVDCRECPFDGLPGGRSRCALLNLDLDGADVEGNIKNAIFLQSSKRGTWDSVWAMSSSTSHVQAEKPEKAGTATCTRLWSICEWNWRMNNDSGRRN